MTARETIGRVPLAGIAAAFLLLTAQPLHAESATQIDKEAAARLEHVANLNLDALRRCAEALDIRSTLIRGEKAFAAYWDELWRQGPVVRRQGVDYLLPQLRVQIYLERTYAQLEMLRDIAPAYEKACANSRAAFRQALAEAILQRMIEGPRTAGATPAAQPPAPPSSPPPDGATEKECKDLSGRAAMAIAGQHLANLSDTLGNKPANKIAHARSAYRKALVLYRDGRERCKHGRWPAYFTTRIQDVERELRKLGVRP
jgi:hypothetical protein